jgi:RNA polymerase sigma-70 factor (ECF subfamily)
MMTKQRNSARAPSSDQLFDELLVVMVQRGERDALGRLYERWNTRLVRAARRYGGSDDGASELAQETWLAICKGLRSLNDPARFRSYAFAILHRKGADRLRRRSREVALPSDAPDCSQPAQQSERAAITQAFAALPSDQRLAAHLFFVEGLTLNEIAAAQAIPAGTAKSRLFHARRKLKAALAETNDGVPT